MKIYAISDMHGNIANLNPFGCDICVIAGDFAKLSGFGKWHVIDQWKWVKNKFIPWIKSFSKTRFVIIPGNHDLFADPKYSIAWPGVNFNIKWPDNANFLLNSGCEINGIKFWGSPNVPIIGYNWAFESEHDTLNSAFSKIPFGIDILITHTPPRISGINLDMSLQTGTGPFGSSELANAIFEKKPKVVFCGHIHSGQHDGIDFNNTKIYNVSMLDEYYQVAYEPTIVDFKNI